MFKEEYEDQVPQKMEEILDFDSFISDDGEHTVVWQKPPDYTYEMWWCSKHQKIYYGGCLKM